MGMCKLMIARVKTNWRIEKSSTRAHRQNNNSQYHYLSPSFLFIELAKSLLVLHFFFFLSTLFLLLTNLSNRIESNFLNEDIKCSFFIRNGQKVLKKDSGRIKLIHFVCFTYFIGYFLFICMQSNNKK